MKRRLKVKSYKTYIINHKPFFEKIMKEKGFDNNETKHILQMSQKNILLRLFLNVVKIEQKNIHSFDQEIALLLIISRYAIINVSDFDSKKNPSYKEKLKELVKDMSLQLNDNIELNILKTFDSKDLIQKNPKLTKRHDWFKSIGNIFASINPNNKNNLYSYGYLVSLFLFISFEYKKTNVKDSEMLFIYKLNINTELNAATMTLSPIKFNHLILKTNRWLQKIKVSNERIK